MSRFRSALWVAVQVFSLASILVAPIWLQWGGASRPSSVRRVSGAEAYPVPAAVSVRPQTITSRTLLLGTPDAPPPATVRVRSAQLRFEWVSRDGEAPGGGALLRTPAASKPRWTLVRIERREGDSWTELPLLRGESNQALGSSFFELERGDNEFRVSFRGQGRDLKSYPLRVRY